jgi:hypothetical protein
MQPVLTSHLIVDPPHVCSTLRRARFFGSVQKIVSCSGQSQGAAVLLVVMPLP